MDKEVGVVSGICFHSYCMLSEICPSICGIDVSAQRALATDQCVESFMVVSICIATKTIAAKYRIKTGFGYLIGGNEIPTLEVRSKLS